MSERTFDNIGELAADFFAKFPPNVWTHWKDDLYPCATCTRGTLSHVEGGRCALCQTEARIRGEA